MTKPRKRSAGQATGDRKPSVPVPVREAPKDIAILHGPTEDGQGARVLRFKEGNVYAGEVRPVREGQSIGHQELVRLRPLDPDVPVCEVEVLHAPGPTTGRRPRPNPSARATVQRG